MRPLDIALALLVCVIWGGNFVAAKISLEHFPPFFFTALRFALTGLLLLVFFPRPPRAELGSIGRISLLSTLHFSLPFVGMAMGLSIASTAITSQLGVPFSCLLGAFMLKDRLGPWRSFGLALAFGGMVVVFGAPNVLENQMGFFLTVCGAFFWAWSNILIKRLGDVNPLRLMAWMALFSTPQLFAISFILEPGAWNTLRDIPLDAALGVAYTVIPSTIIAHGLWYWLLARLPVTQVAPWSLLVPVLGTLFGVWFFHEALTWHIILGGVVTLAGVGIIVIRRPKLATLGEPEPV